MSSQQLFKDYFDADEELSRSETDESFHKPLTWRGSASETFADWTIVVVADDLQSTSYHVHKSVVCFGSRQAKYFARIMLNHGVGNRLRSGQKVPVTKIELRKRDADNFPLFLDYIYHPSTFATSSVTVSTANSSSSTSRMTNHAAVEPSISGCSSADTGYLNGLDNVTTDNAVSLRYLAKRFELHSMVVCVNRFIQRDINFQNGIKYLMDAATYEDSRLEDSARRLCAENIEHLDMDELLGLPLNLFRKVIVSLESFGDENAEMSRSISVIVCQYFEHNSKCLSAGLLIELTDPILIPDIAPEAAIGFTSLIKKLDMKESGAHWSDLVQLSQRSAKAVVHEYGWSDFAVDDAVREYLDTFKGRPLSRSDTDSLLFATSFAAALRQAQQDYDDILDGQRRIEQLLNTVEQSVTSIENSNQNRTNKMEKQCDSLRHAEKQIVRLTRQLNDTSRVLQPQTHAVNSAINAVSTPPDAVSLSEVMNDLISPSQIGSVYRKKSDRSRSPYDFRTKSQMRAMSLLH